ncbi:hypothetical protein GCM10009828_055550 [Actinoplanes couchii]|uniref:Uncharacterized protein n=1 Tax=Actinoplanes couchii TaxID=403638 RepID=A0ABQ3X1U5_9ACTN|nr:hypothetical protein Aco03nite_007840 [Actinoplanes couchii]
MSAQGWSKAAGAPKVERSGDGCAAMEQGAEIQQGGGRAEMQQDGGGCAGMQQGGGGWGGLSSGRAGSAG